MSIILPNMCYHIQHLVNYVLSCPSSCLYICYHVHHHIYLLSCPSSCLYVIMTIILFMQYHVLRNAYVLSCTCFVVTIWPSSCSHFGVHHYVTHALKYIMYPINFAFFYWKNNNFILRPILCFFNNMCLSYFSASSFRVLILGVVNIMLP